MEKYEVEIHPNPKHISHDLAKEYLLKTFDFANSSPEDFAKMYHEVYEVISNTPRPRKPMKISRKLLRPKL